MKISGILNAVLPAKGKNSKKVAKNVVANKITDSQIIEQVVGEMKRVHAASDYKIFENAKGIKAVVGYNPAGKMTASFAIKDGVEISKKIERKTAWLSMENSIRDIISTYKKQNGDTLVKKVNDFVTGDPKNNVRIKNTNIQYPSGFSFEKRVDFNQGTKHFTVKDPDGNITLKRSVKLEKEA